MHLQAVTKFSDRTLVFDNAQIVQDGNHESLMNQEGKYKELYSLQAKYYNQGIITVFFKNNTCVLE